MSQKPGPGDKYGRLYNLGAERLAEVDHKLLMGATAREIANLIVNDYGMYGREIDSGELKFSSLIRQIDRYKTFELLPKASVAIKSANTGVVEKGSIKLDSLQELVELAELQKQRVMMFSREEMSDNKVLSGMIKKQLGLEVRLYKDILQTLLLAELDLGLRKRVPKVGLMLLGDTDNLMREFEDRVLERKQVHKLLPQFLEALEGEFSEAEPAEDGDRLRDSGTD